MSRDINRQKVLIELEKTYPSMRYHITAVGAAAISGALISNNQYLVGLSTLSFSLGMSGVAGMRHRLQKNALIDVAESID